MRERGLWAPTRRSIFQAAGVVLGAHILGAQTPAADDAKPAPLKGDAATFSSDVKVVSVLTTVRSKKGDIVTNLTKDDFELTEDGRAQTIRYFSRETDLPLVLGLLVDTSGSQRRVLGDEKSASYQFLNQVLRPQDRTFIAHFDFQTELLQDLTSSKDKLKSALDLLAASDNPRGGGNPQSGRGGGNNGGGSNGGYGGLGRIGIGGMGRGMGGGGRRGGNGGGQRPGGGTMAGTVLYDAVYLGADDVLKTQTGRKAMVLLTDGVDRGSKESLSTAIETAQRSNTIVYSILFSGDEGGGRGRGFSNGADGKKVLQRISGETGGGFYEVSKKMSLDDIYKRIEEELRNQYSLGYVSDTPAEKGAPFRTISVKARKKDLIVQARQGYYPAV